MDIPPMPQPAQEPTVVSPSTAGSPTSILSSPGPLKSPDYLGFGTMDIPANAGDARPMSWMSVSSMGSTLPSPLFENDIFDSFPAVPDTKPVNNYGTYGMAPAQPSNLTAGTSSFDSAFLSSAIHLAGARSGTTPKGKTVPLPR